jgi:hypothetical protein
VCASRGDLGVAIMIGEESTRLRLIRSSIGPILESVTIGLAGERLPDSSPRVLGGPPEANACRQEGDRTWSEVPGTPHPLPHGSSRSVCWPSCGRGVGGESRRRLAICVESRVTWSLRSPHCGARREQPPSTPRSWPRPGAVGVCADRSNKPSALTPSSTRAPHPQAFGLRWLGVLRCHVVSVTSDRAFLRSAPDRSSSAPVACPPRGPRAVPGIAVDPVVPAFGRPWRFGLRRPGGRAASQMRDTASSTHTKTAKDRNLVGE